MDRTENNTNQRKGKTMETSYTITWADINGRGYLIVDRSVEGANTADDRRVGTVAWPEPIDSNTESDRVARAALDDLGIEYRDFTEEHDGEYIHVTVQGYATSPAATIDISICPTDMEINGDILSEPAVEAKIREVCAEAYPGATVAFQVGYSQGDAWRKVNGRHSDELDELIDNLDWSDESLYENNDAGD